MLIFSRLYFVYKRRTTTEKDAEYYIHFTMSFTPSIVILFFLLVASSIEAGSTEGRDVVVHEGKFT
jgi:hypothetical protein